MRHGRGISAKLQAAQAVQLEWRFLRMRHCVRRGMTPRPAPHALYVISMLQGAVASDPLYSAYHYSHPPLVERLAALDAAAKKAA